MVKSFEKKKTEKESVASTKKRDLARITEADDQVFTSDNFTENDYGISPVNELGPKLEET